ncbi:MAG TPA: hypothetical protein VH108_03765 [Gaiellaceae bacterium]|nr:hypothetical protein [Gaiellaceae bacterium]
MHRAARLTLVLVLGAAVVGSAAAASSRPGVRTPSRNIECAATPAALHCDIVQASYRARLQARCIAPPSSLDWHGFELTPTGKGAVTCSGGILVMGPVRYFTLAYGRNWHSGAYTCRSRVAGLTCTNRAGHGLFLSRLSYRTF